MVSEYYAGVDPNARDDTMKAQLQALVEKKTVLTYDGAWTAFASVDKYLPGYPCASDLSMIPDIYSGYCWLPT
jgi:hypothetical protein